MVTVDSARCRLRLTESELADPPAVRADPTMPPWAGELLDVVARPGLRIVVRIFTAERPLTHLVWATPTDAVHGQPTDDGNTELATVEPVLIPFALALLVGLRRRPAPPGRAPIRVPASHYVAAQDGRSARSDALRAILRLRRTSWRANSAWLDPTGDRVTRSAHVIDAGPAGLWRILVERPDDDPLLLLVPSGIREIWAELTGLLPGGRPATERNAG